MRFILALLVGLALSSTAGALDENQRARIEQLLARIETSNVVFVRNGARHDAREAAAHLRMKWEKAGDRIATAEQFIDRLASRSYLSGKAYLVVLPDGRRLEAGPWLSGLLKDLDASRGT